MNLEKTPLIDPALTSEALETQSLPLSALLLRNECRFPWVVMVPKAAGAVEVTDLAAPDRARFWGEIEAVSAALKAATGAKKINIALFGNMVPQLHAHVIARNEDDPAWPSSAVGFGERVPYPALSVPPFWTDTLARLDLRER